MAKRRLKKSVKRVFFLILLITIITIVGIKYYQNYKYKQSYEYKLLEIKYTLKDTKILIRKLNDSQLNNILKRKHNENIVSFVNSKYFIYNNLDRYIEYQSKNLKENINNIISLVNVNRDRDYYDKPITTNTSLKEAMLVNKYHMLDSSYVQDNLVTASSSYAYADNSLNSDAYEAFKELADAAKGEGYTILILDSYRSYSDQDELWKSRRTMYGTRKADQYAARAGSSEHETGYAIDVADFNDKNDDFGATESYKWMIKNSYKYGYILRYPKGKEDITGYSYEAWHYRYLGKDLAKKVYKSGLTYDEYYEFYLNNVKL